MKACTHCGGPNPPENRVCDYCGMGFDEETIPAGSVDPREEEKRARKIIMEANRRKELVELNLDSKDDQHIDVNLPNGQKIRINDPVEKAAAIAGTVISGTTASTLKKVSSGGIKLPNISLDPDDPRFGPGSSPVKLPSRKTSASCTGCIIPVLMATAVFAAVLIMKVI